MGPKQSPEVILLEPSKGDPSSTGGGDCDVLDRDDLEDGEEDDELLSATTFHETIQTDLKSLIAEIKHKANITVAEQPNINLTVRGSETAEVRLYERFYES